MVARAPLPGGREDRPFLGRVVLKVEKISINLSMKVMPQQFQPFDVSVGFTASLGETDDVDHCVKELRQLTHDHLVRTLMVELGDIYGTDTCGRVLTSIAGNKKKEK